MLKSSILAAIGKVKSAVQDLAITVSHVVRGAAVHVPGSAPTYPETSTDVSIVIVKFQAKEIDGDRIQASDWLGLVFPRSDFLDFNANDVIRIPGGLVNIAGGDYRIINNDKVLVGDTVALHQLQLRRL
jgi:hypothetical protein